MRNVSIILLLLTPFTLLFSAYITNLETEITQPDGKVIECYSSGDEFYNWLHDEKGYTIIRSTRDGYYCFAEPDGELLKPSSFRVGETDPETTGLSPGLKISAELIRQRSENFHNAMEVKARPASRGLLNNIAVFIRFADQEEFDRTRASYDSLLNDMSGLNPSLKSYYDEVSYGELELTTYHYPECSPGINLSYQDQYPRNYYLPYDPVFNPEGYQSWQRTEREHALLMNAVEYISSEVPSDLDIDYNDDGYVDNVCFIIRGVHSAWADLLWAHRWALFSYYVEINGLQVYDYTFQPENQVSVRILSHEMYHALGAPDLYHYSFDGISPAGPWDIMETGFVHMGAYMKYEYGGWIEEIPEITESGYYTLNPLSISSGNCYRIDSPNSFQEFFVLEYRFQDTDTYDKNVPGSGLLVYRIKEDEYGNASGPPDEVYIYRPGGTTGENGSIVQAYFEEETGRTAINDYTDPTSFLWTGAEGGLNIREIGQALDQIQFYVSFDQFSLPPICTVISPEKDAFLPIQDVLIEISADGIYNNIESVEIEIDGQQVAFLTETPYTYLWEISGSDTGSHTITARATNDLGFEDTDISRVKIFDPEQDTWLTWYSDEPVYNEFGRGSIPIMVAADYDLGYLDFFIKKVSINLVPDPFGDAPEPGLVYCWIQRVENGELTEEILADLGSFTTPMEGRFIHEIESNTTVSGKVALVMDISSYQNILFDAEGISGHSWLTEPDRPWVDAVSRGMIGAADIAMMISTNPVNNSDQDIPPAGRVMLFNNYPNPFRIGADRASTETVIEFYLPESDKVSLNIYNLKGQKISELIEEEYFTRGFHSSGWNGKDQNNIPVSSGVYLYQLCTGEEKISRKMILVR